MLRPLAKASSLLLSTTLLLAGAASAETAKIKTFSFKADDAMQPLHVISTDGKTWNAFKAGGAPFGVHFNIDTKGSGTVEKVGIVLAQCGGNQCKGMPKLWSKPYAQRDAKEDLILGVNKDKLPVSSSTGIATTPFGGQILSACNAKLQANGPTKKHEFTTTLYATLVAETGRVVLDKNIVMEVGASGFPDNVEHSKTDSFKLKVVCDPVIKAPTDDLAAPTPDFKAKDVKLFLATLNGANTDGPNPATKCPALRVTTRVQTTKAGPVDVKLWRKQGSGSTTAEVKSAWSSYDAGKNGYFADLVRSEKFDATTYLQFKAEVLGDSFAPSTNWKDITVHCTGAGGGGLSNGTPDAGQDKPLPSWTGSVTMADSAGGKKLCPRKGQIAFDVQRNAPGSFKYRISCSNGQGFAGTKQGFAQGGATFAATGSHYLNISRTRTIQCTLQEVKPSGARVTIDKASLDFTCNKPAFDPQADDLTTAPKPTHSGQKPDVSIFCKPGFMLVGKTCQKKPEVSILCKPGFVKVGKTCQKKPKVSILCKPGYNLVGQACVPGKLINKGKRPARAKIQASN
ncbi:MAG: hypothetical protein LCH46_13390 [Proteobacteria bacterium]|nr:hypothetical protein [Pseudomonadota bacterium]